MTRAAASLARGIALRFRQTRLPINPARPEPRSKSDDGSGVVLAPTKYVRCWTSHAGGIEGPRSSKNCSVTAAISFPTKLSRTASWSKNASGLNMPGAKTVSVGDAPKAGAGGAIISPSMLIVIDCSEFAPPTSVKDFPSRVATPCRSFPLTKASRLIVLPGTQGQNCTPSAAECANESNENPRSPKRSTGPSPAVTNRKVNRATTKVYGPGGCRSDGANE